MEKRTKIVATIGPASQDQITIEQLLIAGVDVARLNFSHGSHDDHARVIGLIRDISKRLGKPTAILQDLQGPKIRTGLIPTGAIHLRKDQLFTLTTDHIPGDDKHIHVDFPELPELLKPGHRILLDDGHLELLVKNITGNNIETQVILGGVLGSHKGVNIPDARLEIPGFTQKDLHDLEFGLEHEVDIVAMSFIRTVKDIVIVREAIRNLAPDRQDTMIIAKLERPEALENLEDIIEAADGVMVARGDLGVEMPPESVPVAQKNIIQCANLHGKVVITATQMLDSMIQNPRPTRAEASDVANAIFDGTDAVMLSGETAVGKFPIPAVEMMNAIICQAETNLSVWGHWRGKVEQEAKQDDTYYLTLAARELAHDRNVAAIAVFTKSGRTALLMSKTRPDVPILAFTPEPKTYYRTAIYYGVKPHLVPHSKTVEEMVTVIEKELMSSRALEPGQQVVLICGYPVHAIRPTNMALLHTIGEELSQKS
ncbi:MAG TPA: pyruvate kinase [Anaerolineales bacterium]|nr:pyruvate kinase [Anaerolineales bacterium]